MSDSGWTKTRLDEIARGGLERRMKVLSSGHGAAVETTDGPKLMFCSNDYLGLSGHPEVAAAFERGVRRWGVGSGGSRLIGGNTEAHEEVERLFTEFAGSPAAVLFPSGYQANVGTIPALTREGDVIFSDALTHASIVDGCRLSRAAVRIFRHRDMDHLAALLDEEDPAGTRLIITDAVFSMDGDLAPVGELASLAREAGAHLYVDEAHSAGVLGPGGRGLACDPALGDVVAVRVFPLGKAFGASGAVVACDAFAAGILRSTARSLLYTTGAPPAVARAVAASMKLLEGADEARARILEAVTRFKSLTGAAGIPLVSSDTPIQPVVTGSSERTMAISRRLWDRGIFVQGIRPPTVEEGSGRLRITICAFHEETHLERLVEILGEALAKIP